MSDDVIDLEQCVRSVMADIYPEAPSDYSLMSLLADLRSEVFFLRTQILAARTTILEARDEKWPASMILNAFADFIRETRP